MSIRNILKDHFSSGFYTCYWDIRDVTDCVVAEVPATARCVHGHYQADRFTKLFPEASLMTWVRDPVERVVSSYYYRLREPDWQHPVCRELHERRLSLVDYAALPLVRNEMTRFMGSRKPVDFAFIGVMEDFEGSLDRMSGWLGIPRVASRRDNCNPEKAAPRYELAPEVRLEIERLNPADMLLHQECLNLVYGTARIEQPLAV